MTDQPKKETRKLAAIMFTDIAGYTALMSRDEHKALEVLKINRDIQKPLIEKNNGEWLKEMGDGSLSCFQSAVDAVNCAIEIQKKMKSETDFKLRIGIHVGDVVFSEGDVFGDGVNVASRIEHLAENGGICISGRVWDDVRNKPGIEGVSLGTKELKNVDHPVKVYAITSEGLPAGRFEPVQPGEPDKKVKTAEKKKAGLSKELIFGIISTVLLIVVLSYGWIIPTYFGDGVKKGKIDSMAVLPFSSDTDANEIKYLSEAIPESIIFSVQQIPDMRVIAFSAVRERYRDKIYEPQAVGNELKVRSLIGGKLNSRGEDLVINIEIVDTFDSSVILTEQYFEKLGNPVETQKNIALDITRKLKFQLTKRNVLSAF